MKWDGVIAIASELHPENCWGWCPNGSYSAFDCSVNAQQYADFIKMVLDYSVGRVLQQSRITLYLCGLFNAHKR